MKKLRGVHSLFESCSFDIFPNAKNEEKNMINESLTEIDF